MKRYYVSVTETLNKVVSVDAESEKEAVQKVQDAYNNSEIILDSDNFCGETVEAEDDQGFYIDYEKNYGETYQHIDEPNWESNLPTNNQNIIDMKNLDEKRAREIADRLEEIRRETNSCSVHNTKPLSKERLLELYSEENELIEYYRDLWKAKKRS